MVGTMGVSSYCNTDRAHTAKLIEGLSRAALDFRTGTGNWPSSLVQVASYGSVAQSGMIDSNGVPHDAWGREIQYMTFDPRVGYGKIWSGGPDKKSVLAVYFSSNGVDRIEGFGR